MAYIRPNQGVGLWLKLIHGYSENLEIVYSNNGMGHREWTMENTPRRIDKMLDMIEELMRCFDDCLPLFSLLSPSISLIDEASKIIISGHRSRTKVIYTYNLSNALRNLHSVAKMSTKKSKIPSAGRPKISMEEKNPETQEKISNENGGITNNENYPVTKITIIPGENEKNVAPPSLGLSRLVEKTVLIGLNNRLAAIIEKNKQLENANNTLTRRIEIVEEDKKIVLTRLETTFDKERDDLRKLAEDSDKDKKKLELEEAKLKSDLDNAKTKLDKKDKELANLNDKLVKAEKDKDKMVANLKNEAEDNDKLKKGQQDLKDENAKKDKDIEDLRFNLEREALGKMELENQLKNKIQEFTVKAQLIEQDVREFKSRREIEIQEIDGRLQNDYEVKLQQVLEELRKEYEKQLETNKEVQQNLFNRKESDLRAQLDRLTEEIEIKSKELKVMDTKVDDLTNKVAGLEGEKHGLEANQDDLKKKLKSEHDRLTNEKKKKEEENQALQSEKNKLMDDYSDLMETKVTLDMEIATYRAMLEGEEERLNLTNDENSNAIMVSSNNNGIKTAGESQA